jgi:hypothetical protein
MRRLLLITFLLTVATGAADPTRTSALDRAYQGMVTAQRALESAKLQRDQMEPEQGDRAGTARGASRLLPEYFERQRSLEREVALAQWRYDQAVERWNALR